MKKLSALIIACSAGWGAQAQLINSFNDTSLSGFTPTLILDNSQGAGSGVSFGDVTGGLVASFSGTVSQPEQALFLTPTALPVGDALIVNTTVPTSSATEDLGIAISANNPVAASSGNGWSGRSSFDYLTISVRPTNGWVRVNSSISGTVTTGADSGAVASSSLVSQLFIENNGGNSFTVGYVSGGIVDDTGTITFGTGSTVGSEIGIYGDIRNAGTSIGSLSDLSIISISAVPEPTSLALFGMGVLGMSVLARRRNK